MRYSLKNTNLWTIMLYLKLILPGPLSLPLLLAVCHQHRLYLHNTHSSSIMAVLGLINPWWWHYYCPLKCGSCFHSGTPRGLEAWYRHCDNLVVSVLKTMGIPSCGMWSFVVYQIRTNVWVWSARPIFYSEDRGNVCYSICKYLLNCSTLLPWRQQSW